MYGEEEEDEGNVLINPDNIVGSASSSPRGTIQNPDFKFTTFENPNFIPKEEYGMMSMMGNGSGGSIGSGNDPKKRFHRHTAYQIREMEAFFEENPHPNDKHRVRLSQELGLTPLQIKFWFQNKRNQIKTLQERRENVKLKAENDTLRRVNQNLRSNLKCISCSSCDGSGDKLRLENSRLRQELDLFRSIASLMNPPLSPQDTASFFSETNNSNVKLIAEEENTIAMDIAVSCVQELAKMCYTNEPLWIKKISDNNNESLYLNEEEYFKISQWPPMDNDHIRREASRASTVVLMNSISLVNAFLDAEKWSEMFCSIVSRAKTIQIISSGVSEVSGASGPLLLMYAELQGLSPLVPTREGYFLRYVEQKAEEGKWMIVDFPIDSFHGLINPDSATTTDQYRRKPSGCIIQDLPNGYSQVTWVEHVEVEEKHVQHEAVREYVKSGVAFDSERWLSVLKRQCERMASLMATNITDLGVIPSAEARRNLMRLSQRMVRIFCLNLNGSYGRALSESTKDTVRITTRKVSGGVVLCAVSTTFLPYSHHQVFDLLCDDYHRSQILFNGNTLQEVSHIANGSHLRNCISLLRNINVATKSSNNVELVLQETFTDISGSLLVYSTVDVKTVQLVLNGKDLSSIPLLPLGFSVVPVNPPEGISANSPYCLLTVGIQVLVSNVATARLNLSTVNDRICSTVKQIISALKSSGSSAEPKQEISW
ncbi:hypothetical protein EUTSA_v10026759mg [Eutrema salsugineum]|uniref:Homeobox domain-containing protein n=1 Tax=Eutrema salsugineum TaxID=72664 RepID=V4LYB1_EUTSA|nr:hypothetical protein EUTSA_v10026759mg [Eutrema salsugineum]